MNKHKVKQFLKELTKRLMVQQTHCRPLPQNLITVVRRPDTT